MAGAHGDRARNHRQVVPFAPTTLTAELGRSPDKTATYATLDGEKTKANLY